MEDQPESQTKNESLLRPIRICDMAEGERPRERLVKLGAPALSHAELIAILLRTGTQGCSVIEVSTRLLQKFGGELNRLFEADIEVLSSVRGIGRDKAITLIAAFELVRRARQEKAQARSRFENAEQIAGLLRECFAGETTEKLRIVLLNSRREVIRIEDTLDGAVGEIPSANGEIFRKAILAHASGVILAHNHPSGDPMPSNNDVETTRNLVRCGRLLGIPVFDHIIIGKLSADRDSDFVSLRALGIIAE